MLKFILIHRNWLVTNITLKLISVYKLGSEEKLDMMEMNKESLMKDREKASKKKYD